MAEMTDASPPIVTEKDQRPADTETGRCFYCRQPIGEPHLHDCVRWCRDVVVRATIEYVVDVPHCWSPDRIEDHRNIGGWCASNILSELKEGPDCLCSYVQYEYVREASEEDSRRWRREQENG